MSILPIRSGSDSDCDSVYSTDSDTDALWPEASASEIDKTEPSFFEMHADSQLQLLKNKEENGEFANKPAARQMLFFSTIYTLAAEQRFDEAEAILIKADTNGVWKGYGAQRAQAYAHLIEQNIEKGVHDKARGLYSRALELSVWDGFAAQKESARRALIKAGYPIS